MSICYGKTKQLDRTITRKSVLIKTRRSFRNICFIAPSPSTTVQVNSSFCFFFYSIDDRQQSNGQCCVLWVLITFETGTLLLLLTVYMPSGTWLWVAYSYLLWLSSSAETIARAIAKEGSSFFSFRFVKQHQRWGRNGTWISSNHGDY